MKARVSPIISADAVAVVRRGLRSEFWPASCPIGPNSRASAAPVARRNGRPITGLAAVDAQQHGQHAGADPPARCAGPRRRTARSRASGMPTAISATPSSRRRRTDDSGSATSSRSAWTGAIRPVRRAGSQAATIVTTMPDGVRRDDGPRGEDQRLLGQVEAERRDQGPDPHREHAPRGRARAWSRRRRRRTPRAGPSGSPAAWRRPSARSSASSRLRWATRIEKVLTMM